MGTSLIDVLRKRWRDTRSRQGILGSAREIGADVWEFVKESTPERRRSLFGDAEYDWEHESNTTSGGVSQRTRLLAAISGAPYQPTEPSLFHEMLGALKVDVSEYVFVDLGSGKGRTLLMAAEYPFRKIVGVELFSELDQVAKENIRKSAHSHRMESICADAREFQFPAEPLVLYLFNPLPAAALVEVVENLRLSLQQSPRSVRVIYHNPISENVLADAGFLRKMSATHQYAIYSN
ncbi:MAG TPA: class I SAM-dependent methyltransferase [Terriglobales bacterium]|nr:class I SAM-dependent methyltransferase [Terriglobales bacterium]